MQAIQQQNSFKESEKNDAYGSRKVFGRKAVKLSKTQETLLEKSLPAVEIPFGTAVINPDHYFDFHGPLHMEIGFGTGEYTLSLAEAYPRHRLIACEVFKNGIATLLKNMEGKDFKNIRIIKEDAIMALTDMFEDESLDYIHVNHPDPWPKKRHTKRRLIQTTAVELFERKLKKGGEIWLCTDATHYYDWMIECFNTSEGLELISDKGRLLDLNRGPKVMTRYEKKGLLKGRAPKYLRYRRTT